MTDEQLRKEIAKALYKQRVGPGTTENEADAIVALCKRYADAEVERYIQLLLRPHVDPQARERALKAVKDIEAKLNDKEEG